jgi:ceramide glucosyltransferase
MVLMAAIRFRRFQSGSAAKFIPAVSILKPLHGDEPALEENLRGFFNQDYPEFEVIFCARRPDDPGLEIARRLAAEYPKVKCQLLNSGDAQFSNAKVQSLQRMEQAASHNFLIVSDSDVRVGDGYLRAVVAPFSDPSVGLVTCLYRGRAIEGGSWAQLEAIGMSVEMTAGVIVSEMLEPVKFALGPTMAVRREALEQIGGFRALGPYCADDFLLGKWIADKGWRCVISRYVIEHMVLNATFAESILHQVRWMKSTRASRPKGHLGTGLTFSVPYGILVCVTAWALHHPWLGLAGLAWSFINRMLEAGIVGKLVVNEDHLLKKTLLFATRDAMGFAFWVASYGSRRILWRGQTFYLGAEGRMYKEPA